MIYFKSLVIGSLVGFLIVILHEMAASTHTKESCVVEYRKCVKGCKKKHDTVTGYELCEYRCDSDYDWCLRKLTRKEIDDMGGNGDNDGEISHPDDSDPSPGATEYPPLGEPGEGDIYAPSEDAPTKQ